MFLPVFSLLLNCTPAKQVENSLADNPEGNTVLFLVWKIRKGPESGKHTLELVRRTVSKGKAKQTGQPVYVPENFLRIDTYRKNRIVHTLVIEHPLYKHVEYAEENGAFSSKDIELDEADFFIRLDQPGDAVQISETLHGKGQTVLTKLKL